MNAFNEPLAIEHKEGKVMETGENVKKTYVAYQHDMI